MNNVHLFSTLWRRTPFSAYLLVTRRMHSTVETMHLPTPLLSQSCHINPIPYTTQIAMITMHENRARRRNNKHKFEKEKHLFCHVSFRFAYYSFQFTFFLFFLCFFPICVCQSPGSTALHAPRFGVVSFKSIHKQARTAFIHDARGAHSFQ